MPLRPGPLVREAPAQSDPLPKMTAPTPSASPPPETLDVKGVRHDYPPCGRRNDAAPYK